AAVSFAARNGGNRSGWRNGHLRTVANAMLLDPGDNLRPIQERTAPVPGKRKQRLWRRPFQIFRIVDAALDGRKRAALLRQFDAGPHAVPPDELKDLPGEFLALFAAVTHTQAIHQITEAHDAQPYTANTMRSFRQLRHRRHVAV